MESVLNLQKKKYKTQKIYGIYQICYERRCSLLLNGKRINHKECNDDSNMSDEYILKEEKQMVLLYMMKLLNIN